MRRGLRKAIVLVSLLGVLGGGVAAMGFSGAAESWLFYFPSRRAFQDPPGVEAVEFRSPDGLRLTGWFFPAKRPESMPSDEDLPARRPTVLVTHGNAGCLPDHDEFCAFLADHGFNVLLFDYRGYGRSDLPRRGLRRSDLVLDTRGAFDYLLTRDDVDTGRIGLLGYSLGGNIGLAFAAVEPRITGVVTLSTFARWREVAADHGGPLGRALISDGLDASETVAGLGDRPYMIVHGDRDDVVLFRHAAILEQSARGAGISVTRIDVEGAHHLNVTAKPATQHAIAEFFARTPERREE